MENIERYDGWYNAKGGGIVLEADPNGVFVLYDDHIERIAALTAENARLKQESESNERAHMQTIEQRDNADANKPMCHRCALQTLQDITERTLASERP